MHIGGFSKRVVGYIGALVHWYILVHCISILVHIGGYISMWRDTLGELSIWCGGGGAGSKSSAHRFVHVSSWASSLQKNFVFFMTLILLTPRGKFGRVMKCRHNVSGEIFAAKFVTCTRREDRWDMCHMSPFYLSDDSFLSPAHWAGDKNKCLRREGWWNHMSNVSQIFTCHMPSHVITVTCYMCHMVCVICVTSCILFIWQLSCTFLPPAQGGRTPIHVSRIVCQMS